MIIEKKKELNEQAERIKKLPIHFKTSKSIDVILRGGLIRYNNKVFYDTNTNSYNIVGLLIHLCGWEPNNQKILEFCAKEFNVTHPYLVLQKVFQLPKEIYIEMEIMEKSGKTLDDILNFLEYRGY